MIFGAMYYIVPRLTGWEWPSASLIRWHFWLTAIGIALMFIALTIGGTLQGFALEDPGVNFMASVNYAAPFRLVRGFSGIMLTVGHVIFAVNFAMILLKMGERRGEPTLFAPARTSNTEAAAV